MSGEFPPMTRARVRACKVCGTPAPLFGAIDFNKLGPAWENYSVPLSGQMVFYNRCPECGFLFTASFDAWRREDYAEFIYNEFYPRIDPGSVIERPQGNAKTIEALFGGSRGTLSILDYGSGNGLLGKFLLECGFPEVALYDPFNDQANTMPDGKFDLITCYEVLEHVPDPVETVGVIKSLLHDAGAVLFSTLVQPVDFDERGLYWSYVSPRSGHISIHSRKSLQALWARHGFQVASFNEGLHIAFRQVPAFARHLFGQ